MSEASSIDWERLRAPFDPDEVDFRAQGRANEQTGRAQVVAYIDARAVQDRLDTVIGPEHWSFDWTPLVIDNGEVMVAKGTLTIHGVSKSDVGTASNFEQSLGAVSHCFKRAAVHWGIGRYLYNLPATWVAGIERGGRIPEQVLRDLRAHLPRPDGMASPAPATQPPARRAEKPASRPAPTQAPATGKAASAAPQRATGPKSAARSDWRTAKGYDPMKDKALLDRLKTLGKATMADVETFLTWVETNREYTEPAIKATVAEMETVLARKRAADVDLQPQATAGAAH